MKKVRNLLYIIPVISMLILTSCGDNVLTKDPDSFTGEGVTFLISAPVEEEAWQTRSYDGEPVSEKLTALRYFLADARGQVINHHYVKISDNLNRLNIDGLAPGNYSLVLLGSSVESEFAEIQEPQSINDGWLVNLLKDTPIEGGYFFKKVDFKVGLTPEPITYEVILERPTAKVKFDIIGRRPIMEELIRSVKVTLDEECLYGTLNVDGSYSGEGTVKDYELRDSLFNLTFQTLPSIENVSGTVTVKAATMLGDTITTNYRFDNLKFEAGKVATISVKLNHPDNESGFMLVRPRDYYDLDADLMLMEDEPMEVLHNGAHRRFPVCRPLVVSTWEKNMRIRLFTAGPVEDVDIYANFPTLGLDSIKMGHIDVVEPLVDMLVPVPFTERSCTYYDVRGKRVTIPKMNDIPSNIEWFYKTPDEYINQLAALKFQRWEAWCPSYETYWARYAIKPTCDFVRHAFIINQCMAIMFDSEEFYTIHAENEGTYIDKGKYLTNEDIINRVYNVAGFGWGVCNPASGAGGWGGGSAMIFLGYTVKAGMYPGNRPNSILTYERDLLYHEFGHCLGFDHDGNMTYGKKWTGVCSTAFVNCYLHGKIKYGVPDFINKIPYARKDAPKWAKPRFVIPEEEQTEAATRSLTPDNDLIIDHPIE